MSSLAFNKPNILCSVCSHAALTPHVCCTRCYSPRPKGGGRYLSYAAPSRHKCLEGIPLVLHIYKLIIHKFHLESSKILNIFLMPLKVMLVLGVWGEPNGEPQAPRCTTHATCSCSIRLFMVLHPVLHLLLRPCICYLPRDPPYCYARHIGLTEG